MGTVRKKPQVAHRFLLADATTQTEVQDKRSTVNGRSAQEPSRSKPKARVANSLTKVVLSSSQPLVIAQSPRCNQKKKRIKTQKERSHAGSQMPLHCRSVLVMDRPQKIHIGITLIHCPMSRFGASRLFDQVPAIHRVNDRFRKTLLNGS